MNQLQVLFYETAIAKTTIEVFYEDESFWLSQKKMAELFGKDVRTINEHLKNIFDTKKLVKSSTIRKFRIVQDQNFQSDFDKTIQQIQNKKPNESSKRK